MKFNNIQELKETYEIVTKLWEKCWTVYSPIKMNENDMTINFVADSYFDPVLSLLSMNSKNVVKADFKWAGEEKDNVVISGCNLDILKKFAVLEPLPDYKNIDSVLNNLLQIAGIEIPAKPEMKHVFIGNSEIPIEDWNEYWKMKGKTGPSSGWEIPTVEQLYKAIKKT